MMHRSTLLMLSLTLLATPSLALAQTHAQIYQWTGAHGIVHYSDSRPGPGIKYKVLQVRPQAAAATSAATPAPEQPSETAANPAPARPPATSDKLVANTPANRKRICSQLKDNIALLRGKGAVATTGADGKRRLLTDAQQRQALSRAQQQQQKFCGS